MKKIILVISLLALLNVTQAQRVGLVLSGGGAKGLYHVGMIKALEENGIPIDYVSGASMGAIVGAMYVTGYSPEQMIDFFVTDSVRTWLSGKIPDEYRYYFKQYDPTPEMISVNINPDKTKFQALQLPTNVISPYRIDLAFMSMLTGASWAADENFDSLMVPFRCVASDVFNKKVITFKNGSLPFAVRTSMTIPLAFKPLEYDSVLLYDGGVYNNFPWQTLQEDFEPDIFIGGVCSGNYANPSQNDIVGQVSVMITRPTDYQLPDSTDIIIKRRFPDVGTLDYSKAAYIMARGYEDAMKMMPEILRKIKRRVSKQEIDQKRENFKNKVKPVIFEHIEVQGLKPMQTAYVMRQLGIEPNQLVTAQYFEEKYMRILATEIFTGEFPEVEYNPETGYFRLKLKMQTKPSLKISIGGNISSTSLNQGYVGFDYRRVGRAASSYHLRGYFGTFYNSVQVGARHDFYTQFPFYIDYGYGYERFDYDSNNNNAYYKNRDWRYKNNVNNYLTTSIAIPIFGNSAFRGRVTLGVSSDNYFTGLHTTADITDNSRFTYSAISAQIQTQTLNFTLFPTEGVNQIVGAKFVSGLESYNPGTLNVLEFSPFKNKHQDWVAVQISREQYINCGRWFNIGYLGQLVISNHRRFQNDIITAITEPAFTPTPHMQTVFMPEYRSPSYLAVGVMPIIKFTNDEKLYLKTYAYIFAPQELFYDHGWQKPTAKIARDNIDYVFGGSLVYQTFIGPASLTVAKYTTGPKNWAFMFNFGFTLFNGQRY